jgi:hypothetical protein
LSFHGHWLPVELEGFVFPLPDSLRGSLPQKWGAADNPYIADKAALRNKCLEHNVPLLTRDPGLSWVNRLDSALKFAALDTLRDGKCSTGKDGRDTQHAG